MRYQYSSTGYKNDYSNPLNITHGVKFLILINVIIFCLIEVSGQRNFCFKTFGLVPHSILNEYKIWQTFTYMFIHGGLLHIVFNMFILWIFGKDLEAQWGKNKFLIFYFICGLGSGFITFLFNVYSLIPIVGASGAIYGLLVAYGFSYPNRIIYLYGLIPISVKYLILGLGCISFFASISTTQSNISHITHLFGMIIGALYMIIMRNKQVLRLWYLKFITSSIQKQNTNNNEKENIKKEMDRILDKINDEGWESLSNYEENFLTNASKKVFDSKLPD